MSSINLPIPPKTLNSFRRLFDWFQEKIFHEVELKNKPHKRHKARLHSYTTSKDCKSFVLELIDEDSTYCMTGFGAGIKVDDFIAIDKINSATYQVVNIEYYLDPSDIWIALLKKNVITRIFMSINFFENVEIGA